MRADTQHVFEVVVTEEPKPVAIDPMGQEDLRRGRETLEMLLKFQEAMPQPPSDRARRLGFTGRMLPVVKGPLPPGWQASHIEVKGTSQLL